MLFVREDPVFTALDAELQPYHTIPAPSVNCLDQCRLRAKMIGMVKTAVTCEDENLLAEIRKSGADEVILALENGCFSALHTFAGDHILALKDTVHEMGMSLTVLMDRLFPQEEAASFQNRMNRLLQAGVDHIIAADPALLQEAAERGYADRLIFDPMTMMTNAADVSFYKELGLSSVTISQLLTADEIREIAAAVPGCSLCVFGHQLMSVSARPLLSAYGRRKDLPDLKGRRDLWLREEKRQEKMPAYENDYAAMIYSDYVLDSFDQLASFVQAGISRIEIRGTFLQPQMTLAAAALCQSILKGDESGIEEFRKTYGNEMLSDGYYGIKTIK